MSRVSGRFQRMSGLCCGQARPSCVRSSIGCALQKLRLALRVEAVIGRYRVRCPATLIPAGPGELLVAISTRSKLDPRLVLLTILVFAVSIHLPIYGDGLNPDVTTYMDLTHSLVYSGTIERQTLDYPRHPPLMSVVYAPYAH